MRAMTVRTPATLDTLTPVDLPEAPPPAAGEIAVRLHASSLNFHDYLVVNGTIPVEDGRIPMSDGAGEVIAVGDGVTEFAAGDRVVSIFHTRWLAGALPEANFRRVPGDGIDGYAREVVVTPADWFTRAPRGYSHAEAATITCAGVTAWRALVPDGPTIAGQTVLVQGSGGVSVFALQYAKAMGARVIATSSSDAKLERLTDLGADHVINYRTTPDWGRVAYQICGGVDHVVEIGGPGTLPQSIDAIGIGGHIALIGVLTGVSGEIPTAKLMGKQGRLQGVSVGSRRDQIDLIAAIDANGLRPVIDRSFALEQLADAFRHQESGAHFGKICIDIAR
ncbi:zinc-dependent alcohol dehydrogenase family protein [Sphingomonas adhaesiva]|uniref:zinc-dependent alcohol dehydrogenase family protein n=1 Tax=Sphingomonas adhaesiva TaxID=28212 RepID=UPI002FFA59FD